MAQYRFYLLNACDIRDTTPCWNRTNSGGVTRLFCGTEGANGTDSGLAVGDIVSLADFVPASSNIITTITGTGSTGGDTYFTIPLITGIDTLSPTGTVNILNGKRYVNPANFYNTKFIWEKEDGEVFFRKALSGALKFDNPNSANKDWDYFLTTILPNECCEVKFVIEKRCDGAWVEEWKGYFTHSNGIWNQSHCNVEIQIEKDDPYTCLLDNKSEKFNVIPSITPTNVTIPYTAIYEELECCEDKGETLIGLYAYTPPCPEFDWDIGADKSDFYANSLTLTEDCETDFGIDAPIKRNMLGVKRVSITQGTRHHCQEGSDRVCISGHYCTTFIREVKTTIDIDGTPQEPSNGGGNTWYSLGGTTLLGFPATKWGRCPSGLASFVDWGSEPYTISQIDYSCNGAADGSLELTFDFSQNQQSPSPISYTTGKSFADVCNVVATKFCALVKGVRSDFFEINPPGDTPGYVSGTNYVTGAANKLKYMAFFQASDFVDPTADEAATIGEFALSDLLELWRIAFNAYWFVDADNYIRVEHISWFNRTVAIDSTEVANRNKLRNAGNKVFGFDKIEIPIREEFEWAEQRNIDFVGRPIKYKSICANPKKISKNSIATIFTDVDYAIDFPSKIDKELWVLIARDPADPTLIDKELGKLTGAALGVTLSNAHLSWANLHYNYHRYDRWLIDGNMNDIDETFESAKLTKRQKGVTYLGDCCQEINPFEDLVTTELGNGQIDKMEKDNRDEVFGFELLY